MSRAADGPVWLQPSLALTVRPRLAPDAPPLARTLNTQDGHLVRDDADAIVSAELTIREQSRGSHEHDSASPTRT
ncbi:hypothetical protein ACLRDC_20415 [Gluconacetobacter sacchari]|uniref:Uncharacterized protein n=2 Tax=Gluconacetobacter sacchari TaxID=92759 RepID=A0A7W4NTW7_9PROT|nr:hypothetical protein [Gluconacetobacter sacchari]MBB2162705.1 hypothetical protein [Gluconacetobacter sacchari]GBQ28836.1 hypothetical protein AA12717_3069 [Gluconacetobacter sacchari DSM 12717]